MTTRVVGDVAVRVGADVGPLKVGLQDGARSVDRFGNSTRQRAQQITRRLRSVTLAAAAMAAAIAAAGRQSISALDSIGKKSAQIGTTAEELQRFAFAARSAGVDSTKLESSLERFVKRIGEAEAGFGAAKRVLDQLGMSAADLANMPLSEAVSLVADELSQMDTAAEQAAAAAALFGREGVAMINMLRDGGDALRDTMNAADDFGAVVSNEAVGAAEEFEDKMGRLADGIKGQLNSALVEMGPLLVSSAEFLLRLARAANGLVTYIGDLFNAFDAMVDPVKRMEMAVEGNTAAMGNEIRQSQLLQATLQQGGLMSEQTARVKLQEAQARLENARAAKAERDAMIAGLEARRADVQAQAETQSGRNARGSELAAGRIAAQIEGLREATSDVDQLASSAEENIARLQSALEGVTNGVVDLGGGRVDPITPDGVDGGGGGGGSAPEARDGSVLDEILGLTDEQQAATQERMENALAQQQDFHLRAQEALVAAREQGLISQTEYDELEEAQQEAHNREMRRLRMEQAAQALGATSTMFDALAQVAGSGGEKLLRISKITSAAQAFVSTMAGAAEALRLPFPANLAAAAQVVSTGAGLVAAIKGASAGGSNSYSGGGGGGSAAPTLGGAGGGAGEAGQRPQVSLTLIGEQGFSRPQIVQIVEAINDSVDEGQQPIQLRGRR